MRTRAGWIALVLTGGLALAPAVGRAQVRNGDLDTPGREQPIVPLPIGNSRPESGGFYGAFQFTMLRQTRTIQQQVIARRGLIDVDGSVQGDLGGTFTVLPPPIGLTFVPGPPGPPGTFLGTGTPALDASDVNQKRSYQPGYTATFGWLFSDNIAVEFKWTHVQPVRYNAGADIIPPGFLQGPFQADTFLTSPVYNFNNAYAGENQELGVGNPGATFGIWNASQEQSIEFRQRYDQGDLTVRLPIRSDPISRTFFIIGERFAWIWEEFKWRTVSRAASGAASDFDVAIYSNITSNRMYGIPIGCQHEVYLGSAGRIGAFSLAFQVDVAPMLDVVKERASYELGDNSTRTKHAVTEYTFSPMLNSDLNLTWYPINGMQVRLGWSSMLFMNTVHAEHPVAFNFGNLQKNNDFGPLPAGQAPPGVGTDIWTRKTLHYIDGLSIGVGLSF